MVLSLPTGSLDSLWTLCFWILFFFCLSNIYLKVRIAPKIQILYIKTTTATLIIIHNAYNTRKDKHFEFVWFDFEHFVKLSWFTLVNWSCSCLIVFSLWLCTTLACWNIFCCCLNICCWYKIKIYITCTLYMYITELLNKLNM